MKLFELAAQGATCPDCGAPLPNPAQQGEDRTEEPPHRCEVPSPKEPGSKESEQMGPGSASEATPVQADPRESDPPITPELFNDLQDHGSAHSSSPDQAHSEPQGARELREDTAQSLRERGYVIEEDAHGLRISSISGARGGGSQLSPSDVVSMAAELGGGVQPTTKLQTCAKCEARTPPGEPNCQWCGEPFPSAAP